MAKDVMMMNLKFHTKIAVYNSVCLTTLPDASEAGTLYSA